MRRTSRTFEKKDNMTGILFLVPALLVLVIIVAYPVFFSGQMSFMRWRPTELTRKFVGFYNYRKILTDPRTMVALRNTFIYGIGGAIGKICIGMSLALLLNQKFPGRGLARTLLMLPWIIPITSSLTTWRWMYDSTYGIFNILLLRLHIISEPIIFLGSKFWALPCLLMVGIWLGYPMMMVMLLAGLQTIPDELYEAAQVEGAGVLQRFWHVTIPGVRMILSIASILSIIWSFNAFNVIWLLTKGGPSNSTHILNTLAYELAFTGMRYDYAAALAMITLLLLAVFLYVFVKLQKEGNV